MDRTDIEIKSKSVLNKFISRSVDPDLGRTSDRQCGSASQREILHDISML